MKHTIYCTHLKPKFKLILTSFLYAHTNVILLHIEAIYDYFFIKNVAISHFGYYFYNF